MNPAGAPLGVYIHWPYCTRVCPYCDFNVVRARGREGEARKLAGSILADLEDQAARLADRRLVSLFFGGGTPSLMDPDDVGRLIAAARRAWPAAEDLEVTLEANPGDASPFAAFADAGVNRLSLGVQSLNDDELRFLGRDHDAETARRALEHATSVFPRVSADLIYALPDQTTAAWASALTEVAAFDLEHLSPYQLTIEPGTAFDRAVRRRAWAPPESDAAAELYDTTQTVLQSLGFEAYEVSNHARGPAARSRHNLLYWRGEDYLGLGPGAHGRITQGGARVATEAPRAIGAYIDRVWQTGSGAAEAPLQPREQALERLLMGLRTLEGVDLADLAPLQIPESRISDLSGFVERRAGRLAATARGRAVLDRLVAELADAA
ncbi:MAG TPA: radical SAM family heme chaperone HemW [Caulobacteraceae bacterium]|nr:radical SAM family heme chaperone HemW [Caulobacteraceae bacterium]